MALLPSSRQLAEMARKKRAEAEKRADARKAEELQKGAVERGNREQERETKDAKMEKKPMKKYATGGSVGKADGIAKKGKTHTKMVKMAAGGMAARAGMTRGQMRGGPARATFKKGGSCGKKGKY